MKIKYPFLSFFLIITNILMAQDAGLGEDYPWLGSVQNQNEIIGLRSRNAKYYHPFTIDAIVILPDHLHMIMTLPENDGNFSLRWNLIKGIFSRQLLKKKFISPIQKNKRESGIWQKRFWEYLIRDELDFEHHVNYIHYNPVKHGHVENPIDWPYSSIHRFIRDGILPSHWTSQIRIPLLVFDGK